MKGKKFYAFSGGRRGLVGPVWQWRRTVSCAAARRAFPSLCSFPFFLVARERRKGNWLYGPSDVEFHWADIYMGHD
jgi:hypothetical protein